MPAKSELASKPELTTGPPPLDTVVACATPWGRSAVAVLRLSGPGALSLAASLCPGGPPWVPRRASLRRVRGDAGGVLDDALVTVMPGPNSYTGEDVVELSLHGNPVLVEAVLDRCVALGARPARPGEYTRRALVNGRVDLLQAEAVDAVISAGSMAGVAAARPGMSGQQKAAVDALRTELLDVTAELEVQLDYPGEDLGRRSEAELVTALGSLSETAAAGAEGWRATRQRLEGARVVLLGPVNAGKSSLFNHLVAEERALVSAMPGTTRDVVERTVLWHGLEVCFMDSAGARSAEGDLERAGRALALRLSQKADLVVLVVPPAAHVASEDRGAVRALLTQTASRRRLVVCTHADLPAQDAGWDPKVLTWDHAISNTTGSGLPELRAAILGALGNSVPTGAAMAVLSQRQHDLLAKVAAEARGAAAALEGRAGVAVAAEHCTRALMQLDELGGTDVRESVLDRLFARFCIGK